jgi:hypothetical protein
LDPGPLARPALVALALVTQRRALRSRFFVFFALPFAFALLYALVLGEAVDVSRARAVVELGGAALSLGALAIALALPAVLPCHGASPAMPGGRRWGGDFALVLARHAGLWSSVLVFLAVGASALLLALGALGGRAFAAALALGSSLGGGLAAGRFGWPRRLVMALALLVSSAWAAGAFPAERAFVLLAFALGACEAALVLAAGLFFEALVASKGAGSFFGALVASRGAGSFFGALVASRGAWLLTLGLVLLGREAGVLAALAGVEAGGPSGGLGWLLEALPRLDVYASPASFLLGASGSGRACLVLSRGFGWAGVLLAGAGLFGRPRGLVVGVGARERALLSTRGGRLGAAYAGPRARRARLVRRALGAPGGRSLAAGGRRARGAQSCPRGGGLVAARLSVLGGGLRPPASRGAYGRSRRRSAHGAGRLAGAAGLGRAGALADGAARSARLARAGGAGAGRASRRNAQFGNIVFSAFAVFAVFAFAGGGAWR